MPDAEGEFDVLCYGTISLDNITRIPFLPTPRRDTPAIAEYNALGGEAVGGRDSAWHLGPTGVGRRQPDRQGLEGRVHLYALAPYPRIDTRHIRQHENVTRPSHGSW